MQMSGSSRILSLLLACMVGVVTRGRGVTGGVPDNACQGPTFPQLFP